MKQFSVHVQPHPTQLSHYSDMVGWDYIQSYQPLLCCSDIPTSHYVFSLVRCMLELKFATCHRAAKSVLIGYLSICMQYWLKNQILASSQAAIQQWMAKPALPISMRTDRISN